MPLDSRPLLPVTTITRIDNTSAIHNPHTGVKDFVLKRANIKPPVDATGGSFEVSIVGVDANTGRYSLGDTQSLLGDIEAGYEILFSIGKTSSTTDVFRGIIEEVHTIETGPNYMEILLNGLDWGTMINAGRIVSLFMEQKRLANGKDPDSTDYSTMLPDITRALLGYETTRNSSGTITGISATSDAARKAYPGDKDNISNRVSVADQGVIVVNSNIQETQRRVPKFEVNMQRLTDAISQVDALNGTISYVKPNKEFVQQYPFDTLGVWPSGILLTDDAADPDISDPTNYGLIIPPVTTIRSLRNHRRRLLAVDQTQGQPDQKQETDTAGQTIDTKYWAVKFTPKIRNCSAIAVRIAKIGSPVGALRVELREDNNNAPMGSIVAVSEKLPGAITTADWHYFPVNEKLNTQQDYWIVVNPNNVTTNVANSYSWRNGGTGASFVSASSNDGIVWTLGTTGFCFRQDFTDDVLTIFPFGVTSASMHLWEEVVKKQTLSNNYTMVQYLISQFSTLSKKKEMMTMKVRSPDTLLQPGMQVRVKKQKSGYNVDANYVISEISYQFDSTPDLSTGTFFLDVTASRFVTYN